MILAETDFSCKRRWPWLEIPQIFPPPSAVGILAPCLFPIRCTARCLPIPVHGLDLPPLLPRFAAKSHLFAAKYVLIWRQIAPVHTRRLRRSRATSPPFTHDVSTVHALYLRRSCTTLPPSLRTDFHLRRNGNRHLTLYLQVRDDFLARETGEPPVRPPPLEIIIIPDAQ